MSDKEQLENDKKTPPEDFWDVFNRWQEENDITFSQLFMGDEEIWERWYEYAAKNNLPLVF